MSVEALNNISHPRPKAPLLPALADRRAAKDLDNPGSGRRTCIVGQLLDGKETMRDDLVVGDRRRDLPEVRHHKHCHVVPAGDPLVKEYAMETGWCRGLDIGLLAQFANERIDQGLAWLDPTARQVPAAHIAVLNQQDAPFVVDHERARP